MATATFDHLANVYTAVRGTLELLYFLAGIVLVYAAIKALGQVEIGIQQVQVGLEQIRLMKEVAQTATRREAYRTAHEQCKMYASEIVPKLGKMRTMLESSPSEAFNPKWRFSIKDGEYVDHNFDSAVLAHELNKLEPWDIINSLEAFAMFFVDGIADEKVGYRETAAAYCYTFREFAPIIWICRVSKNGDFKSAATLYEIWNDRLNLQQLQKELRDTQKKQELLQQGCHSAAAREIPTIGLEPSGSNTKAPESRRGISARN